MPVVRALPLSVGRGQSQRPPQGKGPLVLLLWGCTATTEALESWVELGPYRRKFQRQQNCGVVSLAKDP